MEPGRIGRAMGRWTQGRRKDDWHNTLVPPYNSNLQQYKTQRPVLEIHRLTLASTPRIPTAPDVQGAGRRERGEWKLSTLIKESMRNTIVSAV